MIYVDIFEKAYQFLQDEGIAARRHIELKQYTTLHIGGEAQILAEPSSITQIQQCLAVCKQHRIEWFLLGNGSNVLAMDEGFQGMVIVLATNFNSIRLEKEKSCACTKRGSHQGGKCILCSAFSERSGVCLWNSGKCRRGRLYECRSVWRRNKGCFA